MRSPRAGLLKPNSEKRIRGRGMKFYARKREQGTRLKPSERNQSVECCGRSKTSERLEIQYRLDIHRERQRCRVRKISEGGERDADDDDDDDGTVVERKDVRSSDIRLSDLAVNKNIRFSCQVDIDNKFLIR